MAEEEEEIDEEAIEREEEGEGDDDVPPGIGDDDDDGDSSDDEKPPPTESLLQKFYSVMKGTAQPATTYGPPYLQGQPKIDQTLIDECDMAEPSVKDVHAILNETVNPNVVDPDSYNDTAMIKLSRHCYTPESVKILDKLEQAGAHVNKCNRLGITPLHRACMARPPKGPPEQQRLKFIQWLCDHKGEPNAIDKGGFTPMYHAASNNDIAGCKVLMVNGGMVRPNQKCKNPIEVAKAVNNRKLEFILQRKLDEEQLELKRKKLEREKSALRAAEHRRKMILLMEDNAKELGGVSGPKYKLDKFSPEESAAMARRAYEKAAEDAVEAQRRKDDERVKQLELLKAQEHKAGVWKRLGKMRYRFLQQGTADDEEETRTMALGQNLYDEITFGPKEKKLRLRWREKTGLQKRQALPPLQTLPDSAPKKHSVKPQAKPFQHGDAHKLKPIHRSSWMSYPGAPDDPSEPTRAIEGGTAT